MANTFWVRDVVDGNTLAVEPSWVMDGKAGSLIRAAGLHVPPLDDPHGSLARTQMMLLLLGQLGTDYARVRRSSRRVGVRRGHARPRPAQSFSEVRCLGDSRHTHAPAAAAPSASAP